MAPLPKAEEVKVRLIQSTAGIDVVTSKAIEKVPFPSEGDRWPTFEKALRIAKELSNDTRGH